MKKQVLICVQSIILIYIFACIADTKNLDPYVAIEEAEIENLKPPKADSDGRVQTLNKKGAMSPQLDRISQAFIEFAAQPGKDVLEIGASYGFACLKALELGASSYTANDLDERHLKILATNINSANPKYLNNIRLIAGSFPETFKCDDKKYDAILIARVLHFMHPKELREALNVAYKILKPGGKIYAVMLSPYVKGYRSFISEFEMRIEKGVEHPGYVSNLSKYTDLSLVPQSAVKNLDQQFFFFDIRTARKVFEESNFVIEKNIYMPLAYHSDIWQLDGRENVGVIAIKP